jgi:xanthine dehydrogenase YagS FAD-binding subunit
MQPFGYIEPRTLDDTLRLAQEHPDARFLAGGTTIVDLMKSGAMRPSMLIDINRLDALNDVVLDDDATLHIGALARMSDVASNDALRREAPGLSEALLFSASGQLRNMASIGGNLLQRTRCLYLRDRHSPVQQARAEADAARSVATPATSPSSARRNIALPAIREISP